MELTPYSEVGMRKLSRFHAEQMLYEYACGTLDEKRKQALEEYLKTDEELTGDLEKVRKGLSYLQGLGGLTAPQTKVNEVRSTTGFVDRAVEALRIEEWHPGFRLGVEATAVVSIIFMIAIAVPWNTLFQSIQSDNTGLTLAEIRRDFHKLPDQEAERIAAIEQTSEPSQSHREVVFDDEGTPSSVAVNIKPPVLEPAPAVTKPTIPEVVEKTPAVKAETLPVAKKSIEPEPEPATAKRSAASEKPAMSGGVLYRGSLRTTNVEATTPKLIEFLAQAGGRKAGQVPLGWKKDQGSYFHFTIPEAKYGELEAFFGDYGTLVITKERHERVMPEGIIRLIIDVEEKNPERQ